MPLFRGVGPAHRDVEEDAFEECEESTSVVYQLLPLELVFLLLATSWKLSEAFERLYDCWKMSFFLTVLTMAASIRKA